MPDWQVERGTGEDRLVRIIGGEIVDARIHRHGTPWAGDVLEGRITAVRPQALAHAGEMELLLPHGTAGKPEGARVLVEVTREPIPGAESWKRPLGRVAEADAPSSGMPISELLPFPAPRNALDQAGWDELIEEARSGTVAFACGTLRVFVTPAMTLIDVDGSSPPEELAAAAARAATRLIRRHDVGGSIGIDFPTLANKAARQRLGELVDAGLERPFERTALNGFGFLQIVRPRRHPSLFELAADKPAFEARALLRRAAREVGSVRLACHPAVAAAITPKWLAELGRQVGGTASLREDPRLAMSGGHAERV